MEGGVQFEFVTSNNVTEYKALILGRNLCHEARAKILCAFSNSQLIFEQVNQEFEANDESMKIYLQRVKEFITKFDKFTLTHTKV